MLDIATPQDRPLGLHIVEPPIADGIGLVSALLSISKSIRALHGLKLGELGFSNGQDELLIAIPDEGLPVSEMADRLMVRPSTISKMMNGLVAKGLIERMPDRKDKRLTKIWITPAGREARKAVIEVRNTLDDGLCNALDEATAANIEICLIDCADRLAKRLRRLR